MRRVALAVLACVLAVQTSDALAARFIAGWAHGGINEAWGVRVGGLKAGLYELDLVGKPRPDGTPCDAWIASAETRNGAVTLGAYFPPGLSCGVESGAPSVSVKPGRYYTLEVRRPTQLDDVYTVVARRRVLALRGGGRCGDMSMDPMAAQQARVIRARFIGCSAARQLVRTSRTQLSRCTKRKVCAFRAHRFSCRTLYTRGDYVVLIARCVHRSARVTFFFASS